MKKFLVIIKKFLVKIKNLLLLFIKTFIKPFWFSSSTCKKEIVVPYVYTTLNMSLFYLSVYIFLKLSWQAGTIGIKNVAIVLPTLAGVIATLIILNHSMMTIYNNSKKTKKDITEIKTDPNVKGVMEE